jgi:TatD family-associated radical SAM protein
MKENVFVYELENSVYINLTNRCSNACTFCVRASKEKYDGKFDLWLEREPTAKEVIKELKKLKLKAKKEAVFCGYGEPTYRLNEMLEIAKFLKKKKISARLNTNGLANLINGRDITRELVGLIPNVSISLNAPIKRRYDELCNSEYENAFDEMLLFASLCKSRGLYVAFTAVDVLTEEEVRACEVLAEDMEIGFRLRKLL